jgi:predicted MPP superfamily phosphohydrolase
MVKADLESGVFMMMSSQRTPVARAMVVALTAITLLALTCCSKKSDAQTTTIDLQLDVKTLHFISWLTATRASTIRKTRKRPILPVRVALVQAIADTNPAFICFTGDIVYNGYDTSDWKVWDSETSIWRDKKIPVYPALGNHDLHGDEKIALGNYFQRFPDLKNSRYYSVRAANTLILVHRQLVR